jgi:hypothetical protein
VSYEALIAAQAKRLTKKRERGFMQYDWPSAEQITDRFDRMAWRDDCRAYADLYVPPAPEHVEVRRTPVYEHEMSHTEWADGYKRWQAEALRNRLPPVQGLARLPCFAENEI